MKYQVNFGFHAFAVPSAVADNLLRLAKENHLKVLLYLLRYPDKNLSAAQIAAFLRISEEQAEEALAFWSDVNILQETEPKQSAPETPAFAFTDSLFSVEPESKSSPQEPEIKSEPSPEPKKKKETKVREFNSSAELLKLRNDEIAEMRDNSPEFRKLLRESWKFYRHDQNHMEVRSLLWIHMYLGFSVDVILLLLDYCSRIEKFSIGYIDKIAYSWWEDNITTVEEVQNKIRELLDFYTYQNYITRVFQLQAKPTKKQTEFIELWQGLAFSEEMLIYARDLSVEATGKVKFNYIDAIFKDWSENHITTTEEAAQKRDIYLKEFVKKLKAQKGKKKKKEKTEEELREIDEYLTLSNRFKEDDHA